MTEVTFITDLTADQLRALVDYDPLTGHFTWKVTKGRTAKVGWRAGTVIGTRYISIMISGKSYLGHRLAWLHHYGEWPPKFIDHIDRVRDNNAIANLRLATRQENARNIKRAMGFNFIKRRPHPKKFQAQIKIDGKDKHLGFFLTPEEAREAYLAATKLYFGEFSVEARPS